MKLTLKIYQYVQNLQLRNKVMTSKPQTFTVSLKVAGEDIKLHIDCEDTIDDVFEKLRRIYPNSISKKIEIIEKLTDNLKLQLGRKRLNANLLNSIEYFLSRNEPSNKISNNILETSKNVSLVESKTEYCEPLMSSNRHENIENSKVTIKNLPSYPSSSNEIPSNFSKKSSISISAKQKIPKRLENKSKALPSTSKKSKCNPDVIKACEIIMKKVQNNEMKHMAKEFLKEKGYLKQEKEKPMNLQKCTAHEISVIKKEIIQPVLTEEANSNGQSQNSSISSAFPINVLNKLSENNASKNNIRANRYKYLQSSLANQSYISKECQLSKCYQTGSIIKQVNSSNSKQKKYSYLQ